MAFNIIQQEGEVVKYKVVDLNHPENEPMLTTTSFNEAIAKYTDLTLSMFGEKLVKDFLYKMNDYIENKSSNPKSEHPMAIKSVGMDRIKAYGVLWGDEDHKDIHEEFFTPETKGLTAYFDAVGGIPWLYQHTADATIKYVPIGVVDKMGMDDTGLWYEARITEHELYRKYIKPLIDSERLFSSSGTLPLAKTKSANGWISQWPIAEMTGTHIPAEWRMLNTPVNEIKTHYSKAVTNFDATVFDSVSKELDLDSTDSNVDTDDVKSDIDIEDSQIDDSSQILIKMKNSQLRLLNLQIQE